MIGDNGQQETCEITCLERKDLKPATLGLTLAEGKEILKDIQEIVIQRQAAVCLAFYRLCPDCGHPRTCNGYHDLSVQTVFGHLKVKSARLRHCGCRPHEFKTFSPLADIVPEHTTPELLFLETKWASLMSYGMTTQLMQDVLPMDEQQNAFAASRHALGVAERLGESSFNGALDRLTV